jgi:hypothetical protein
MRISQDFSQNGRCFRFLGDEKVRIICVEILFTSKQLHQMGGISGDKDHATFKVDLPINAVNQKPGIRR